MFLRKKENDLLCVLLCAKLNTYLVSYVLGSIFMFCKKRAIDYYFNSTGNTIEVVVIEFPPNVRDSIDKFCKSSLFRRC